MLVDTHCHIHDPRFDEDRAQVLKRARESGVGAMITIGCDLETTKRAFALAQVHPDVYFSAGYHPHEAKLACDNWVDDLRFFARHKKCVAIGECGLDFYYEHSPRELQIKVFQQQLNLAQEVNKALVIHVRDAYQECLEIIADYPAQSLPVVIHCFTGTLEIAKSFLDLGCYISISGIATFKEPGELDKVIEYAPIERLLVETDSPYLAPLPFRGKRNEPSYVVKVAEKVANFKSMDFEEAAKILSTTSQKIFNLPNPK